ncbi:MAG: SCO family protein [Acidimicrobiales bacterium]
MEGEMRGDRARGKVRDWARRRVSWIALGAIAVLLAAAAGVLAFRPSAPQTAFASDRVSGVPSNVPTALSNLMGLSPVRERGDAAPGFSLTDQLGRRMSLSSFRGHPVVLTFLDPRCVTMCPIIAQELADAARHLKDVHPSVVFLAVNVNRHALGVATVRAFTDQQRLGKTPTWHFLTGHLSALERIWSEYGIYVKTRIVHGQWTVVHTTVDFFIGPTGKERYAAAPNADYRATPTHRAYLPKSTYASWGRGIALVSRDL